ncbi:phosphotransferase family protein [Stackebrandtia nassauensis]|uniref:Aminoglycoside phosphotransferase domain-containing protein n=1 Tax=Stackebrandtia nassauensis (strain DSM 44728 / CIP 108903 / NRRL B-16338 / NBRC 102104 / LLR-40K-21) TaxID=446470 RepID=D3Q8A5_STANL|nr:aminoglycoside phosphotransferase family protein [Stackebrandtia nassauensis]ADD42479.1 hypothetical protein Snas_2803 [Stackebrandtia nassauensis DSM 44728]
MSRLSGTPWRELGADVGRDARVLDQLAEVFAHLHSVRGKGFGPVTDESDDSFGSWAEWLRQGLTVDIGQLLDARVADRGLLELAESALSAVAVELADRPGALVHGDLGDGEVFVDATTGRVTGIADWGAAVIGDPFYDFARFVAGGPVDDARVPRLLPGLRAAYAARTGIDWDDHRRLMDLYDAHNAVNNAAWALREGVDWVASLRAKAERLLQRVVEA